MPHVGESYIEGVPDLIVEILSPTNWTTDRREQFKAYERAGVKEYWIVDYRAATVELFLLQNGGYVLQDKFGSGETIRSQELEDFQVKVDKIFE